MINVGVKYPNINAKLKGMYAKRISREDLEHIIKQNNLKNAILLLKSKSEVFKNVDENIDRLEVSSLLEQAQIIDIKKILKLLNKKDEKLFRSFLIQYEIRCIKSTLRKLFTDDKTSDIVIQNAKIWIDNLFNDINGIETAQSFEEFFGAIKRMKYSNILGKYKLQENFNIYELENQIDKFYFEKMFEESKGIKNLNEIIGSEIDLLNILWIYRTKKYYNFEKEQVKELLINKNYKLTPSIIDKLLNIHSFEEINIILQNTVYKYIFKDELSIENNIDTFLYDINKKIFKEDIMSISYIFAYFNIIEYENNDIINIIEGIRYNMDKQEIKRRMVR